MPNFIERFGNIREHASWFEAVIKKCVYVMCYVMCICHVYMSCIMSCVIDRSWLIQEFYGLNLDWFSVIALFSIIYSEILLYIILPKILAQIGSNDTALQFFKICLSSFLWNGTTFVFILCDGKCSLFN